MSTDRHSRVTDSAADLAPRLGGVALANGLVVVSSGNWAAAVRQADGTISVASGKKPQLPGTGESRRAAGGAHGLRGTGDGIPVIRGLGRFAESLIVLGVVKKRLPSAQLPFENRRVATALAASMAGATAVRAMVPRSALMQEAGTALAAFIPAMVSVKNSAVSGYHGAEHKVIGAREEALRAAGDARIAALTGDAAAAPKEHDRCGSNLVGPFMLATVLTNLLARDRSGRKTPLRAAAAGAASLGLALEAMRWANKHADSVLARLMMMPGRAIQKGFTTSEPSAEQLEVGERALAELLRLEAAEA
jgi:uncharacterized protein YqhQ